MFAKKRFSATLVILMAISSTGMCNDFSPYSPAYIVDPYDVLSTSSFSNLWNNSRIYDFSDSFGDTVPSQSFRSRNISVQQSLVLGLPENFEIGFNLNYSDNVFWSRSPSSYSVGELGNPAFIINKFWGTDSALWGKASFQVTPKTGDSGQKAAPSTYQLGLTGIYVPDANTVASLGITQLIVDPIYSLVGNSTSIQAVLSKTLSAYLLNVRIGAQRYDPLMLTFNDSSSYSSYTYSSYQQTTIPASYAYNAGFDVSTEIVKGAWVDLSYYAAYQQYKLNTTYSGSVNSPTYDYSWAVWYGNKASSINNVLTISLKYLF